MNTYMVKINLPITIMVDTDNKTAALRSVSKMLDRFENLTITPNFNVKLEIHRLQEELEVEKVDFPF